MSKYKKEIEELEAAVNKLLIDFGTCRKYMIKEQASDFKSFIRMFPDSLTKNIDNNFSLVNNLIDHIKLLIRQSKSEGVSNLMDQSL
jgi:hypothetical protein